MLVLTTVGRGIRILVEQRVKQALYFRPFGGINAITNGYPLNGALDNADFFQLPKMLADGRLGKSQLLHQVPVDTGVGFQEILEDRHPGWVGDGFGYFGELVLFCSE